MLRYFRKWSIALKRRRLKKERELLKRYDSIEADTRGDGNRCYNCKAPLTGPYCHICGQRDDDLRRPIWTFFRELFDAIFDTDSKIIKTILLLIFQPGGLSRAFMEGRRARFLPPFRLYVVLLFVFFSTLSLADILIIDIHVQPKAEQVAAREALEAQLAAAEEARDKIEEAKEFARERRQEVEQPPEQSPRPPFNLDTTFPGDQGIDAEKLAARIKEDVKQATDNVGVQQATQQISAILEALEELDQTGALDSGEIEEILEELAADVVAGRGRSSEQGIRRVQARVQAFLDSPNVQLAPKSRSVFESILALDASSFGSLDPEENESRGFSIGDLPYDFDFSMFVANDKETRDGIKQEDIDYILEDPNTSDILKKATSGFADALRSPREFNKLFNDWLPWALVILMPVFAGILRFTHWGKRRYYLNQLVFALHFHSFLFVMLTAFAFIVPRVGGENAFGLFWWGTSAYLVIALKVGQDQSWIRAFLKAGFIWVSYFVMMMLTMAFVMFLGISDSSVGEFVDMIETANEESTTAPAVPSIESEPDSPDT